MKNAIGIIGCGWLGLPLAISLVNRGNKVHGSTTSEKKIGFLRQVGIQPYLIRLSEDSIEGPIAELLGKIGILLINVPPKLRGGKEDYVKKMERLHDAVIGSTVKKVIFISSTSVYGDMDGEVDEETFACPTTESGKQLLVSENIFRNDRNLKTTIVRYGGLIGPDRHPVNHLAGRSGLANGNFPINLIHLDDAIAIIGHIISQGLWGEVFNGVNPYHPSKRDYYTSEAKKRNLPLPKFLLNSEKEGKKIRSYRLINVKKFDFTTSISG